MPMYEYKCGQCGQVFEVIQRFSDEPLTTHEGCGGSVERLLSAPALQFKGSGFYITDYAKGSGGSSASSNGGKKEGSSGDSASSSSNSSDSSGSSKPSTSTPSSSTSSDSKK